MRYLSLSYRSPHLCGFDSKQGKGREPLVCPSKMESLKRVASLNCCRKDASTFSPAVYGYGRGLNTLAYFDPLRNNILMNANREPRQGA